MMLHDALTFLSSLLRMLEDDLDDPEAKFTRHVQKMIDHGSLNVSGPIRLEDILRKNEVR